MVQGFLDFKMIYFLLKGSGCNSPIYSPSTFLNARVDGKSWSGRQVHAYPDSIVSMHIYNVRWYCFSVCWFWVFSSNSGNIWRRHHYRRRAGNFNLSSSLMAIEQWGFFSMPHLLWHGVSVYNIHLRRPVTLTCIAERLAVELSLPVLTNWVCRGWDSNTQPSANGTNALTDCTIAAAIGIGKRQSSYSISQQKQS